MEVSAIFEILGFVLVLTGIGKTFFGRRFFRWWLGVQGALIGALGGLFFSLLWAFEQYLTTGEGSGGVILFAVGIGAVIGWKIAYGAYRLVIFALAGLVAGAFTYVGTGSEVLAWTVGLLAAGAALVFERKVVIYYTAITGGFNLAYGASLVNDPSLATWLSGPSWIVPVGLMIAVAGVFVQTHYTAPSASKGGPASPHRSTERSSGPTPSSDSAKDILQHIAQEYERGRQEAQGRLADEVQDSPPPNSKSGRPSG